MRLFALAKGVGTTHLPIVLLALPLSSQIAPPSVGVNGFVAFVERDPNFAEDFVTLINSAAAAGTLPGAAIVPPAPVLPGTAAANGNTLRWRLNGRFSRNEQTRGRQTPREAPLTIAVDTVNGQVMVLAKTFVPGTSLYPAQTAVESMAFGPGGAFAISTTLLGGAASGPYPIALHMPTRRAFVSDYATGNSIVVHELSLGPVSGVPSLLGTFTPPAGQDTVARCAGFMVYDQGSNRLQVPTSNAIHSVGFNGTNAPPVYTMALNANEIVGTDIVSAPAGGQRRLVVAGRYQPTIPAGASSWYVYDPLGGLPPYTGSFGFASAGVPWVLGAGFHTPAVGVRDPSGPIEVVTFLLDNGSPNLTGSGRVELLQVSPAGTISSIGVNTQTNPFGEPEAARDAAATGDPVTFMLSGSSQDSVQAVGLGPVFPFGKSGGPTPISSGTIGGFNVGRTERLTSLPGGTQWVINGDFAGAGIEVFDVVSGPSGPALVTAQTLAVAGASTTLTTPYLNGPAPFGSAPFFIHGFVNSPVGGIGAPYAAPPVVALIGTSAAPGATPLPPGAIVRVPQIQNPVPSANLGPMMPLFLHDGAQINDVYHDLVGGNSQLSFFLGGAAVPATYTVPGGGVVLSELAPF